MYSREQDGKYYCLLPGRIEKEIPYVNWYEDIDWTYVYYGIFAKIIAEEVSCGQLIDMALPQILELLDIRV